MQLPFKYNWRRLLQTKSTFILSILFIYIVTFTGVVNISTHRFYLLTSVHLFQPGRLPSVFLIGYVFEQGIISVCLSDNALISPSLFKNSFAIYRILDWHYFCLDPNLAGTLILDFWYPELWGNKFLLFKTPSLWYLVMEFWAD